MSSNSEPAAQPPARPARLKNLLKNLALSAASLLLCLAFGEVVLRIMGYGNVEIYEPDSQLFWRLKPNQRCFTKVDHKPVRINSLGTRGAEFEPVKPPDTVRIVSLGDSRTFGWGLTEAETYSGRLQTLLQERVGARPKIEVINAGVNAWSYSQMLLYFRERALPCRPDFVLIADGNLWTQFSEHTDPEFVRKFMTRVRLKNLLRRFALYHFVVEVQLKEFYERHRTKFIPVDPRQDALFKGQQQKHPDAVFREAIEGLCRLAQTNGVKPVLLYLPLLNELESGQPGSILRLKQTASRQLHVPLLDFTADLKPRGKELYLEADPVHLNASGNEIVGRRLFELLSPMVKP